MLTDRGFVAENSAEREHLQALVERLTDQDLSQPLAAGWSVAGVLAHLAFWDQRALVLLRKWRAEGIGPSPIDGDTVNEAMRGHCTAIPPRVAAEMALAAALAIDREIELLDAAMVAQVQTVDPTVHLDRAPHRRDHLGEIESALGIRRVQLPGRRLLELLDGAGLPARLLLGWPKASVRGALAAGLAQRVRAPGSTQQLMGRTMHEVTLDTEAFHLRLVFADVRYAFLGWEPEVAFPKDYPLKPVDGTTDGCVG